MTLSDRQGRAPIANLFECDFSCSFAAAHKSSTDIAHRAVPLRQLSVVFQHCVRISLKLLRRDALNFISPKQRPPAAEPIYGVKQRREYESRVNNAEEIKKHLHGPHASVDDTFGVYLSMRSKQCI